MARNPNPRRAAEATQASRVRDHLARARAALKNKEYAEADSEFRRALALDDTNLSALAGRVLALTRAGRVMAAQLAAKQAIAAAPGNAQLQFKLGQLLARQKRTRATGEATLREAVRLNPGNAAAGAALGRVLARQDRNADAVGALRDAIVKSPESIRIRSQLAQLLEEQHELAEAAQLYREIHEKDPENPRASAGLRRVRDPLLIFGLFERLVLEPEDEAVCEQLAGELGISPSAVADLVRFVQNPTEALVASLACTPLDRELLMAAIRAAERQAVLSRTGTPAPCERYQIASEVTDPLGVRGSHENWTPAQWLSSFVLRRSRAVRRTAVVAAFRDEGLYVLEWVAHYRVLGFEKIFIYSNDNLDGSEHLLLLLAEHGIITYIENRIGIHGHDDKGLRYSPQIKAYGHALHLLPELWEHEWALFVDGDELLVPDERYGFQIGRVIDAAVDRFPERPPSAICFNWLKYVSGSTYAYDERPLLRRFLHAEPRHGLKSLVALRDVLSMHMMHFPKLVPDGFAVRSNLVPLENHRWRRVDPVLEGGYINHYWNKSFEEFALKKARGNATRGAISAGQFDGHAGADDRTKSPKDVLSAFFSNNDEETKENYAPPPEALVVAVEREKARLSALPGIEAAMTDIRARMPELLARFDGFGGLRQLYEEARTVAGVRRKRPARPIPSQVALEPPAMKRSSAARAFPRGRSERNVNGRTNSEGAAQENPRAVLLERMPKSAVCAEIGVWKGNFSQMILRLTRPRELHLVDPWAFFPQYPGRRYGGQTAHSQDDMDTIFAAVASKFRDRPQITLHRMTSSEASKQFVDNYFDWVYVDGDHSYEAVMSDLRNWWPKIKAGGCLAGDDYRWRDEHKSLSVKAAVEEFAGEMAIRVEVISEMQFLIEKARGDDDRPLTATSLRS